MVKSGESKKDHREADADRRHWLMCHLLWFVAASRVLDHDGDRVRRALKATYSLPDNPTTGSYLSSNFTAVTFYLLYLSSSMHHGVLNRC